MFQAKRGTAKGATTLRQCREKAEIGAAMLHKAKRDLHTNKATCDARNGQTRSEWDLGWRHTALTPSIANRGITRDTSNNSQTNTPTKVSNEPSPVDVVGSGPIGVGKLQVGAHRRDKPQEITLDLRVHEINHNQRR